MPLNPSRGRIVFTLAVKIAVREHKMAPSPQFTLPTKRPMRIKRPERGLLPKATCEEAVIVREGVTKHGNPIKICDNQMSMIRTRAPVWLYGCVRA